MNDCFLSLSCFLNVALVGAILWGWRTVRQRLAALEGRLTLVEQQPAGTMMAAAPTAATMQAETAPIAHTAMPPSPEESVTIAPPLTPTLGPVSTATRQEAEPAPTWQPVMGIGEQEATQPAIAASAPRRPNPLLEWFVNMHLMVQVGIVLLFFGVGFLVKYAAEQGWFPLEIRLASAAALGVVLAAVGWRLRKSRRTYGLALIGGGIGIVYLTSFGAYFFYGLLPATLAFTIFVTLSLIYAAMALLNDAPILAFLAIVGAFLSPLLASNGDGNHIVLFSYYGVVNLGVLAIARYKHWSRLNLVSFAFSALAAAGWAVSSYQPAYFLNTALFLTLFFGFYLLISLWQAYQPTASTRMGLDVGDLILLFANPIVSFLLASGLLAAHDGWLAYCALALTLIYGTLSFLLTRRATASARFVADSSFFFAAFFLTIAIPLRFDAQLTAAIWSVMGVGLVWLSVWRGQRLLSAWGVIVHLLAMGAFLIQLGDFDLFQSLMPYLNHLYLSTAILSLTMITSGALLHRNRLLGGNASTAVTTLLLILGLLWWYGGGVAQYPHYAERTDSLARFLLFLIISGLLAETVGRWLQWEPLRWPVLTVLPSGGAVALYLLAVQVHPFAVGWYAWPVLLAMHLWMLHGWRRRKGMAIFHAGGIWLAAFLWTWWVLMQTNQLKPAESWPAIAFLAVPLLVLLLLGPLAKRLPWPVAGNLRSYVGLAAAPIAIVLAVATAIIALINSGNSAPLRFLPLLNPLDCTLLITVVVLWQWGQALRLLLSQKQGDVLHYILNWLLAALALLVVNGAVARTVHHLLGVPYTWDALYASAILQMSYALLWGLLALTLMFIAHSRRLHQLWMIGAAILALTVIKLFLVDLAQIGTLSRIVSFLGVGLLTITIAYFWPAPPRHAGPVEAESVV